MVDANYWCCGDGFTPDHHSCRDYGVDFENVLQSNKCKSRRPEPILHCMHNRARTLVYLLILPLDI